MSRERALRRHMEHVARSEPPDGQHRRIVGRLNRQPAVGRQRRDRFSLERGAAEELVERRLQQAVVEGARGKYRREGHGFSIIIHGMLRRTLIDFYADLSTTPGTFVVYDDGYRSWSYTYAEVAAAARRFAERLRAHGIGKGRAVAIWGENR